MAWLILTLIVCFFIGVIKTGCPETPIRGSFFCADHASNGNRYAFRYRKSTLMIDISTIKPRIGNIKSDGLTIHDTFVDSNDILLILVDYLSSESHFWVTSKQILASKVESYIDQLKALEKHDDSTCNSSKLYTLPCLKKNRTVGMFLGCFNCGIISGYREIFGTETIAQAAAFLLNLIDFSVSWPKVSKYC